MERRSAAARKLNKAPKYGRPPSPAARPSTPRKFNRPHGGGGGDGGSGGGGVDGGRDEGPAATVESPARLGADGKLLLRESSSRGAAIGTGSDSKAHRPVVARCSSSAGVPVRPGGQDV